jgi:solute carrier family 35 protein E3
VTDVSVKGMGLVIAAISVVSSGMQQILCGTIQRTHKLQSHQLLANTAPVQGVMLLLVGPFVDKAVSGSWVSQYVATTPGLSCLLLSCIISVGVNISQFMCLGRFSAVTFQVSM